jgi:hypothetical protein
MLPNGKVLIAGGRGSGYVTTNITELYDPALGTWTVTGSLNTARQMHTATLLPNGKVLVAGGVGPGYLASAELYDPATGKWTPTGSMNTARFEHTATLLNSGKVLIAGGHNGGFTLSSAELFDPASGTWTNTGQLNTPRYGHTATLLPSGTVLVAGGNYASHILSSTELYDPPSGTWTNTGSLKTPRQFHTATLLVDGKVLDAGGENILSSAELYDPGLGYTISSQPQIASLTSPLALGGGLVITGAQFRGVAEGSSGNSQDSAADYPLVQLRSLESGQTTFLLATNWQTNSFASVPVWNFPPGWALATVFANGIQSTSAVVNVSVPVPQPATLTTPARLADGSFQFTFTNSVGALFGVLASTNLSLPRTNWMAPGGIAEISPGRFQFTDSAATNTPQRFYQLRSP